MAQGAPDDGGADVVSIELARIDSEFRIRKRTILADAHAEFVARRKLEGKPRWWADGPRPPWRREIEERRDARLRQADEDRLRAIQELELRQRVLVETHVAEPTSGEKSDARSERARVPTSVFWYALEQRVKNGKLAKVHALSEQTRRNPNLPFVGRTRMKNLVAWIDAHPEQARHAWELHDIPAGFRATADGVIVPRVGNAASLRASR